jgi:hypothetical protein
MFMPEVLLQDRRLPVEDFPRAPGKNPHFSNSAGNGMEFVHMLSPFLLTHEQTLVNAGHCYVLYCRDVPVFE